MKFIWIWNRFGFVQLEIWKVNGFSIRNHVSPANVIIKDILIYIIEEITSLCGLFRIRYRLSLFQGSKAALFICPHIFRMNKVPAPKGNWTFANGAKQLQSTTKLPAMNDHNTKIYKRHEYIEDLVHLAASVDLKYKKLRFPISTNRMKMDIVHMNTESNFSFCFKHIHALGRDQIKQNFSYFIKNNS